MVATYLHHGNVVAGAAAEGHGVLVGWRGHGELTRTKLMELVAQAGIPQDWAPEIKNPNVQLTRAIQAVAGTLYNPEQVKKKNVKFAKGEREWASRWMLVSRQVSDAATAGDNFGEISLVATLFDDDSGSQLVINTNIADLETKVRYEYETRIGAERYIAADITKWLGEVLRDRFDAVRYGGNWYVPRNNRAAAEALCEAFWAGGWGTSWMRPALPIATSAQLSLGLALGLETEVNEVMADLALQRQEAQKQGKQDISEKVATSFMIRLRAIGTRMITYSNILGDENIENCRNHIHDAMIELDKLLEVNFDSEWTTMKKSLDPVN